MTSGTMPCAASVRITPIWAKPRAAPPPSASPMDGRVAAGRNGVVVASAERSPLRTRANNPSNTKIYSRPRLSIGPATGQADHPDMVKNAGGVL